jgi:hypothetical protein
MVGFEDVQAIRTLFEVLSLSWSFLLVSLFDDSHCPSSAQARIVLRINQSEDFTEESRERAWRLGRETQTLKFHPTRESLDLRRALLRFLRFQMREERND